MGKFVDTSPRSKFRAELDKFVKRFREKNTDVDLHVVCDVLEGKAELLKDEWRVVERAKREKAREATLAAEKAKEKAAALSALLTRPPKKP